MASPLFESANFVTHTIATIVTDDRSLKHDKALQKVNSENVAKVLPFATMDISDSRFIDDLLIRVAFEMKTNPSPNRGINYEARRTQADYIECQRKFRGWLTKLVKWPKLKTRERAVVLADIKLWVDKVRTYVETVIDGDRMERNIYREFGCAEAVLGEVLLIIHSGECLPAAQCRQCDTFFIKSRADHKTCSSACRVAYHRRDKNGDN